MALTVVQRFFQPHAGKSFLLLRFADDTYSTILPTSISIRPRYLRLYQYQSMNQTPLSVSVYEPDFSLSVSVPPPLRKRHVHRELYRHFVLSPPLRRRHVHRELYQHLKMTR
ncbi:hypothetical protein P692DRAFT_201867694 [Suillus brevipes Sb2]|nr:hypothetical protein P692DRAFT_201867694 [Suillus brevipes Sb2]